MTMGDTQTYSLNQDGSITIKRDGKSVKFVPESDLGAVKGALKEKESELSKHQTEIDALTNKFNSEHQTLLEERAAKEQFEKQIQEAESLRSHATELETKLASLEKVSGETATKLTARIREHIKTAYKIPDDKLMDKALADLENIESTLQMAGIMPSAANYDGKGGPGAQVSDLQGKSPLALATMGYEASNKK